MRLNRIFSSLLAVTMVTSLTVSTGILSASAETNDYVILENSVEVDAWDKAVTVMGDDLDISVFKEKSAVYVEYKSDDGAGAVEFVCQSWTDPNAEDKKYWAQIAPDSDDGNLAIFSYETIIRELQKTYNSSLDYLDAYHIAATDKSATVEKVYISYDITLPPIEFVAEDGVLTDSNKSPTLSFDMSDWNKYIKVTPDGELTGISMSTIKQNSCQGASLMISSDLKEDITDKYPSFANRLRDADNKLLYPGTEDEDAVFYRAGIELDAADFGLSTFDGCAITFYCGFTENAAKALLGQSLYVYPSNENYDVLLSTPTEIKIDTISKNNIGYYVKSFISPPVGSRSTKIIFEFSQISAFSGDLAMIDNILIQAPSEEDQYVNNLDGYNNTAEIRNLASDKLTVGENNVQSSVAEDNEKKGINPIIFVVAGLVIGAIVLVVVLVIKNKNKYY